MISCALKGTFLDSNWETKCSLGALLAKFNLPRHLLIGRTVEIQANPASFVTIYHADYQPILPHFSLCSTKRRCDLHVRGERGSDFGMVASGIMEWGITHNEKMDHKISHKINLYSTITQQTASTAEKC